MVTLYELEELECGASAAPWDAAPEDKYGVWWELLGTPEGNIGSSISGPDAQFIAAIRNAFPLLVAELRAARKVMAIHRTIAVWQEIDCPYCSLADASLCLSDVPCFCDELARQQEELADALEAYEETVKEKT